MSYYKLENIEFYLKKKKDQVGKYLHLNFGKHYESKYVIVYRIIRHIN